MSIREIDIFLKSINIFHFPFHISLLYSLDVPPGPLQREQVRVPRNLRCRRRPTQDPVRLRLRLRG
jgi:hypothetical protein